jgi:hypothetical protein
MVDIPLLEGCPVLLNDLFFALGILSQALLDTIC